MRLQQLQVWQFRNLAQVQLIPHPDLTVITGQNGQGKTNLLEAIWMLSGAKSFRAAKEIELLQRGQTWGRITGCIQADPPPGALPAAEVTPAEGSATAEAAAGTSEIPTAFAHTPPADSPAADLYRDPANAGSGPAAGAAAAGAAADTLEIVFRLDESGCRAGRTGKKNGVALGRAGNLAGQFPCVVFEPGHIQMVSGPPEGRRRFVDAALCQLYPGYLENLRRYTRALLQKNSALRTAKQTGRDPAPALLDSFDSQLAHTGAALAQKRRDYLAALAAAAAAQYAGISQGREALQLQYSPGCAAPWDPQSLAAALAAARPADLRAGFATAGIHRDDIDFYLDDAPAKTYASQGQRRSIVLSAKIAELELIGRLTGQTPVLLLDDVLSELDDARQDYLLHRISGKQVFLTCCNPGLFAQAAGLIVTVEEGRLIREDPDQINSSNQRCSSV